MTNVWFSQPVPVATGIVGDIRYLSNAQQALDLLLHNWREQGTEKYKTALHACRQAMAGSATAGVARDAVIEAAREARVLVE